MRVAKSMILILAIAGDRARAQQSATVSSASAPARPVVSKREMERRRRIVDIVDAPMLDKETFWLTQAHSIGTNVLTSQDEQTSYLLVRRSVTSQPEVHARWDDLVIVRSGAGAIEVGDSLIGSRFRIPGERVGGTMVKAFQITLHVGDIVRIPATVPHTFVVSGKEPLEYLVIKQRRQQAVRWLDKP